jgi:hypothetical protein
MGFTSGVVTPGELYRSLDDRPRVSILYTGSEADFVSVEDDGYPLARGIRAGQTFSFPVRVYRQNGESRTFFMKGYRVSGSDTTFVGYRCRKVYFQGGMYGGGQSEPWVVDHLIALGDRSGGGCY